MFDLSIVIPAYNEAQRLPKTLDDVLGYLKKQPKLRAEVIVINDGSTDQTHKVAEGFKKRIKNLTVIDQVNQGKGGAVKTGMLKAIGDLVIFVDADDSTPFDEIDKLLTKIRQGYEIAIGSRAMDSTVVKHQSWYRELAGRIFGRLSLILLLWGIKDSQCGFKLFKKETVSPLFGKLVSRSAIFDLEILALATQKGFKIAEVPVRWLHDPDSRITYNLKKSYLIFIELLKIRRRLKIIWPLRAKVR